MKRISTLVLIVVILGLFGDLAYVYNDGFDLNQHIPFLCSGVLLFFWGCLRVAERRTQTRQSPNEPTAIQRYFAGEAANDDGKISSHAQMRANTPDGLG